MSSVNKKDYMFDDSQCDETECLDCTTAPTLFTLSPTTSKSPSTAPSASPSTVPSTLPSMSLSMVWLVLGLVIMVASCVIIDRRIGSPGLWWVTLWVVCRRRRKKVSSGYDGASDNDRGGTRNYHLGSSAVTYDLSSRVPPSQTCRSGDDRFIDEDANISNNSYGNVEMPRMY